MARRDYYEFLDEARDTFGLSYREAQHFWQDFGEALGYRPDLSDLREYGDLAADVLYGEIPEDQADAREEWEASGDPRSFDEWFEDEWLDAYEDMEITEDVEYQEAA